MEMRLPVSVYLQVVLATFLWGTAFPVVKRALEFAPPLTFAGMRFVLAGAILILVSSMGRALRVAFQDEVRSPARTSADWPRVFLISILSTAVFYGLFFLGMNRTSASSGAVIDGMGPVIGAVLAHFALHNDRLTWRRLTAISIAFIGVCIMALVKPAGSHAHVDLLGCLLIFLGQTVNACGTLLVVTYRGRLGLMRLTGIQQATGGCILLVFASLVESSAWRKDTILNPAFLVRLLWLALVSATAFRIWYGLLRRYKITSLSVFSFLTATWGAILSALLVPEPLTWPVIIGLTFVAAAVIAMNLEKSDHARVELSQPDA